MNNESKKLVAETEEMVAAREWLKRCVQRLDGVSHENQLLLAFVAGQQWLRDKCARLIPLDTLTLEGAFNLLRQFLFALPENWSLENAIDFMLEYQKNNPKKGL